MGYAIPVNLAKNLAENIIYHCNGSTVTQLNRPMLGITITAYVSGVIVDPESGDLSQAQLVEVSEVSSTGLAAGKIAVGDIIKSVSVDGVVKNVTQTYQIPEHILTARVGSKVILTVDRGGIPLSINFVITENSITLEK
jgi:S1-C subfamily serine protease